MSHLRQHHEIALTLNVNYRIIELAHTACIFNALYIYTVKAYGDPTSLIKFPIALDVTILLHGATVIIGTLFVVLWPCYVPDRTCSPTLFHVQDVQIPAKQILYPYLCRHGSSCALRGIRLHGCGGDYDDCIGHLHAAVEVAHSVRPCLVRRHGRADLRDSGVPARGTARDRIQEVRAVLVLSALGYEVKLSLTQYPGNHGQAYHVVRW